MKNKSSEIPVFKNLYSHELKIPMPKERADFIKVLEVEYPNAFGIFVKDDSMEPYFIENDILVCTDVEDLTEGSIILPVFKKKNEIIYNVRRLHYNSDGSLFLQPFNVPQYMPDVFGTEEILKMYKIVAMVRHIN